MVRGVKCERGHRWPGGCSGWSEGWGVSVSIDGPGGRGGWSKGWGVSVGIDGLGGCSGWSEGWGMSVGIDSLGGCGGWSKGQGEWRSHVPGHRVSGDDLFSTLKTSQSFSNSNLGHLRHSLDSDRLRVLETLWSTSYSEPLPAVPNTTARSLHSDPSSDTPSKDCSETSLDSVPSDLNSTPMFLRDSPSHSRDKVAPAASDIKVMSLK